MSDFSCTMNMSDAEGSAVSTRWGTFAVDLPSSANSDGSEYNLSWAARASNHSPTPTSSQDLPALGRFEELCGDRPEGPLSPGSASGAQSVTASEPAASHQVMIKNILNRYNKKDFMEFLDTVGLKGAYNGLYLPIGRTRKGKTSNLGYAFLDLKGQAEVELCRSLLNGLVMGTLGQQKCIEIAPVTTQHPSKKFHKCPRKAEEQDQGQFGSLDNVEGVPETRLGSLSFAHNFDCDAPANEVFFGQPQADVSTIRAPPGLELPINAAEMGGVDLFCFPPSPINECDHFHAAVRMPQVYDQPAAHLRHLAPLPSRSPCFAIEACNGCFSV